MNFLEEYKQSQTTFNISFLLRNFASLLEFADTFAVDNFFDSSHEQFAMLEKGIYLGLFGVVVLLTLAIYCHIYLIEQSVDTVYLLLSQIGK